MDEATVNQPTDGIGGVQALEHVVRLGLDPLVAEVTDSRLPLVDHALDGHDGVHDVALVAGAAQLDQGLVNDDQVQAEVPPEHGLGLHRTRSIIGGLEPDAGLEEVASGKPLKVLRSVPHRAHGPLLTVVHHLALGVRGQLLAQHLREVPSLERRVPV